MSTLSFPGFQPAPYVNVAVLTDSIVLGLADAALSSLISSSLTTKPGGSSATVSTSGANTTFSPDVAGYYQVTMSAGGASAVYNFFIVSTTMFNAAGIGTFATGTSSGATRPQADRRLLLAGLAQCLTVAQMTAWAAGTFPQVNLATFGG